MQRCPNCGEENADRAKFCSECATPLAGAPAKVATERKVVSVLFVDLVGFTTRSERADPEDVQATLAVYHDLLKREIERFGGTVEKFVGDAVMAVFGAPVAHEDDAERAVRSSLRIVDAIAELNEERPGLELAVRGAVNTGEAVVTLGARPEAGEGFVSGDVVNTASRLQGVAPVGGIVVGELTRRATGGQIEYEELEPVSVKGKEEPIPIWRATGARSRFGVDVEQRTHVPLVGRDHELNLLRELFGRVVRDQAVQLVTISGEPGVGKTRLLWEFQRFVDDLPDLVYWRQGRCLPYGEGVTYWALGEAMKSHAGILESDGPEEAEAKLAGVVTEVLEDEEEREWVRARLAPLVGVASQGGAEREESFAAWRGMLDAIAATRPLVLIFEDLHWADEQMLGFIEHLVEWSSEAPILVLCTARPELYERSPGWGGGKRNATTIGLSPLSADETALLLAGLLEQTVLPADMQAALLERSGGNPLYAEEFVRMLIDGGALVRRGRTWELGPEADVTVPDSVQALIAARLDTLPAERKGLLHDAAVVGKVFWSGVLVEMGGREDAAVRDGLHELGRKELVRSAKRSSVRDQAEYAFWHALIRDVAYGQIPRSARADKHLMAARWIEATAGERAEDVAELLAHHYEQALELSRAAGGTDLAELEEAAGRALAMAGERTHELDPAKAESYYRRALELLPLGDPARKRVWDRLFWAVARGVGTDENLAVAEAAVAEFRGLGDRVGEAVALGMRGRVRYWQGDRAAADALLDETISILESEPAGPELVDAYANRTGALMMDERSRECIEWADRTMELAERFGVPLERYRVLGFRGVSRANLGDVGGLDDLRAALAGFRELGDSNRTAVGLINLGDIVWITAGPADGLELYRESIDFAERRGLVSTAMWPRAEATWTLYDLGGWDELLRVAGEVLEWDQDRTQLSLLAEPWRALVLLHRGDLAGAEGILGLLDRARAAVDAQVVIPAVTIAAMVELERGNRDGAVVLIRERVELVGERESSFASAMTHTQAARLLAAMGELDLLEVSRRHEGAPLLRTRLSLATSGAILAEAQGQIGEALASYREAAGGWASFGNRPETAFAEMGAGRCLLALGRFEEAGGHLRDAREIFRGLGAVPLIEQTDDLLARATAKSS